jgi:hypothetical protein
MVLILSASVRMASLLARVLERRGIVALTAIDLPCASDILQWQPQVVVVDQTASDVRWDPVVSDAARLLGTRAPRFVILAPHGAVPLASPLVQVIPFPFEPEDVLDAIHDATTPPVV